MRLLICIFISAIAATAADDSTREGVWFKVGSKWMSQTELDSKASSLIRLNDPSFERANFILGLYVDSESADRRYILNFRNKYGRKSWRAFYSGGGELKITPATFVSDTTTSVPPTVSKSAKQIEEKYKELKESGK